MHGGGKCQVLAIELERQNIIYFADTKIVQKALNNKDPYLAGKIFKFNFKGRNNRVFLGNDVKFGKFFNATFTGNDNSIELNHDCTCSGGTINFEGNENTCVIQNSCKLMPDAKIVFKKNSNFAYIGPKSTIHSSAVLSFSGNNAVAYCCGPLNLRQSIALTMGSIFFYGGHNNNITIRNHSYGAFEGQNILIGSHTLFAADLSIRTSDIHLIYDNKTLKRTNTGKSIIIGKRVWIGKDCILLKGAKIEDGCIVGTRSIVTGHIPENCICAGSPAKVKRENIFWDVNVPVNFTRAELEEHETYKNPIAEHKGVGYQKLLKIDEIEPLISAKEKIKLIEQIISN